MKLIITLLFLLGINFFGYSQVISDSMSVSELKKEMKTDSSLVILDVRTPEELQGPLGKIDGVVNIPLPELESRVSEVEKYKDKNLVVICRTGHRSGMAQQILKKHRIKSRNVTGGMTAYRETELPIKPTQIH